MLDDLNRLNQLKLEEFADPEIATRIAQYELAYRMQTSVPELVDLSKEPDRCRCGSGRPDVHWGRIPNPRGARRAADRCDCRSLAKS